jgi:hypothetical protein
MGGVWCGGQQGLPPRAHPLPPPAHTHARTHAYKPIATHYPPNTHTPPAHKHAHITPRPRAPNQPASTPTRPPAHIRPRPPPLHTRPAARPPHARIIYNPNTHTHARTHVGAPTYTHTPARPHPPARTHPLPPAPTHPRATRTHAPTHPRARPNLPVPALTHTHTHTRIHTHTESHTESHREKPSEWC